MDAKENTGDGNTGDGKTGDGNTGYFCTETPTASFFDRPTNLTHEQAIELIPSIDLPIGVEFVESKDMSDQEKAENPSHTQIGGYMRKHEKPIREYLPLAWAKMSADERARWTSQPNFDAEKFLAITGVDVRTPAKKSVKVRTVTGEVVEVYECDIANPEPEATP